MKNIKLLAAAALCVSFSPFLSAQEARLSDKDYFTVAGEAVTLTAVENGKTAVPPALSSSQSLSGANKSGAAGGIVNAGMAAWSVINSGAPSGSYSSAYASAIPGFSFNWGNIAEWKGPKEMVYRYTVTNLMGIDVIDVKYKISFFYGGTEDYSGKGRLDNYVAQATGNAVTEEVKDTQVHGRYITNFTVQPVSVNIKWGWKFDLAVKMSDPMNIGTKMNPVAALQASLNWIRSTPFATNGGTLTYNVDGLGNFKDLTAQEKALTGDIAPVQLSETPTVSWN
ncbi:MAG: hypothetical protein A2X35_06395 [Elusimicrobia bacterium GWA2_61_42]|nr:MAG: hypothetical protein A2X35_06395 [Elusimicrobia bacterium GWA2_61_42]OGR78780.1 MAG: hypothetical protein A2X38_04340 [Elusimicrobia bacterium GWC2_61_25]